MWRRFARLRAILIVPSSAAMEFQKNSRNVVAGLPLNPSERYCSRARLMPLNGSCMTITVALTVIC